MNWNLMFFTNSILLGVGLAMDAFSVSLANGLNEPKMKKQRAMGIAGVFAFFQALMPMLGWICVHSILQMFLVFEKAIPWIAFLLLSFIGGKMIRDGIKKEASEEESQKVGFIGLLVQGVATSIDALSVGFTISEYNLLQAVVCALLIAAVTFVICLSGLYIGKKSGTKLADKATVFGGCILIFIGVEILINSMF